MSTRDDPAELARRAAYFDTMARRAASQAARDRLLAGSRTARSALADAFAPVTRPHLRTEPEQAPLPVVEPPAGGTGATYTATYPPTY